MKKAIFTTMALGLVIAAHAQTPEKKSVALVTKQTGTWCVNCGTWGWPLGHDLYSSLNASGKGIFMAVYDNSGPVYGSPDLVNSADQTFDQNFETSGVPNFYVNGVGDPTNTSTPGWSSFTDINPAMAAVDAFVATVPVVSSAANYSISGNTITSTAKAQFWSNATGSYFMGSYIVEDSVMAPQYPIAATATAIHVGVLRASMTLPSYWGEQIGTGSITANSVVTKNYTATLDASWNKSHLRVFTVIWKMNGGAYEVVNSALSKPGTVSGINELANTEDVLLFPNPSFSGSVVLSLKAKNAMKLDVDIIDATGRNVYSRKEVAVAKGANNFTISTENLSNGIYNVVLTSGNDKMTQRLSVVK